MRSAPRIYNLFPRLAGPIDRWIPHLNRAAELLFDWVYVNPFHYPGFSGSLYAVKDYHRLNPLFLPETWPPARDDLDHLRRLVAEAEARGLRLMMDLVINHTAKDSLLAAEHPDWFLRDEKGEIKSPSAIDPADARRVTVWGDLAEVDNHGAPGREELWAFWEQLVATYTEIGFAGFRCDAAYQVPAELWRRVIDRARGITPDCLFFAETLGCRLEEIEALGAAGFDLIASSSKWWDLADPWCLEQREQFRALAPSVSFPESHDTDRLAAETGGLRHVQVQRYLFAAVFSAGILMPVGYEYGFRKRLNVVTTMPGDWEEARFDITAVIRRVNDLKRSMPILGAEGRIEALWGLDGPVLCLRKTWEAETLLCVINKDWHQPHRVELTNLPELLGGQGGLLLWPCDPPRRLGPAFRQELAPGEAALLLPAPVPSAEPSAT
jgi:starch synthase (maltosyl-transferring)